MKLTLRVEHDPDVECPCEYDGWKLYSFSPRHGNYKHPEDVGLSLDVVNGNPVPKSPGLRQKLDKGLAFVLSCYQHGSIVWSLKGSGPQCPWDTAQIGGILIWEGKSKDLGPKTIDDRREDARRFIETYTSWANGDCYWYSLTDEDGETIDSCGGYIGPNLDPMFDSIAAAAGDDNEVSCEGSDVVSASDLKFQWEKFVARQWDAYVAKAGAK